MGGVRPEARGKASAKEAPAGAPAPAAPAPASSSASSLGPMPLFLEADTRRRVGERAVPAAARTAERGVDGAAAPLPHVERIQASFGDHDVTHARAAIGGAAGDAADRLGARGFAIGDRVGFAHEPDLRLAAHEAAHVVQQRRGVQLDGGVGRPGDPHERAADQVADAVVAGRSAEPLLDAMPQRGPRKAVQKDQPKAAASHEYDPDGNDEIVVFTSVRDFGVALVLRTDAETAQRFDDDPALLGQLSTAIASLLNPPDGPLPETTAFINGPLVRSLLEKELPLWSLAPGMGFPALTALLAVRAEVFKRQRVRVALERWLGVEPGTVDWPSLIPGIRDDIAQIAGSSLRENAWLDRADQFLLILEGEVAGAPPVVGGVVPPDLSDRIWEYVTTRNTLDEEGSRVFSEKLLGEYVDLLANIEYVPAGFDLERFRPSGTDLAEDARHQAIDLWVDWAGPELTSKYVLDQWTTSGQDFQYFLDNLDLDAEKEAILDFLADEFMKQARDDADLKAAIHRMADDRARFDILARLVRAGRAAEKANRELVAKIDAPDPSTSDDLDDLIADPKSVYETSFYLAQATRNVLGSVSAGASYDESLVASAASIAGKGGIPATLPLAAFILAVGTELLDLQKVEHDQRDKARREIKDRVDLSWDRIKEVIAARGEEADVFLQNTWIPMLKQVATDWVTANYTEIKDFYDHFDERAPQMVARYRLCAWMLDDVANKLESGELESSTLNGQTVTIDDVKSLRTAVATLRAKADQLDAPQGQSEKYDELSKAVEAYTRVKANIENDTYKPENYGEAVVVEAKHRLGIGVFEGSTLWQQATRQVTVRDNPFQAYAIAMWRVENIIEDAASNLLSFFGRGLLTLGSLLVPGVGGLILAAIDIGIGLYGAYQHIGDAKAKLDLARLDTQLDIQGITVADAEHAVTMAYVSFAIQAVLAGVFTVIGGVGAFKGIKAWRFPNLTKLAELDAVLAEKIVSKAGNLKTAETLLGHFAGDGQKVWEALAYASDVERFAKLVGEVKDVELLQSLLIGAGSDAKLLELMESFKDLRKLDQMLGSASPAQLTRLFEAVKDEQLVIKLVEAMAPERALQLLDAGLTGEQALALDRLGPDAIYSFNRLLVSGDRDTLEAIAHLLELNQRGRFSSEVAEETLRRTADFMAKYQGRVSGDFVSRFSRVVDQEAAVAKAQARIDELRAAGRSTTQAERTLLGARTELGRAQAETDAAVDILEGRSVFGSGRSVHAIPEAELHGVETPEFRVSGGGQPDALAEVKAVGEDGRLGKNAIERNFRKAASQLGAQGRHTGETGGLVRLDASATGRFSLTNEEIASNIQRQWGATTAAEPGRIGEVAYVEVIDQGAAGPSRLLLKIEGRTVSIVPPPATTRVYP